MDEGSPRALRTPTIATWRYLALGACLLAMFWPVVEGVFLWAGSNSLVLYFDPVPSVWVGAFVFGVLVARMEAMYVAGIGIVASVVVSIGLSETWSPADEQQFYASPDADMVSFLSYLAVPWIWIAVFAGLGVLVSGRLYSLLRLPRG